MGQALRVVSGYTTKRVLTRGIEKVEGTEIDSRFYSIQWKGVLCLGEDFFLTLSDAIADAKKRLERNITALNKQIASYPKHSELE
jgi:hypothetical protein